MSLHFDAECEEESENAAKVIMNAMQKNIDDVEDSKYEDGQPKKGLLLPDMPPFRIRITETVRVLTNSEELRDPSKCRDHYTTSLLKGTCAYYEYTPFLAGKLFSLSLPQDALAFFDTNQTPRAVVLRTNTLRTSR
jgi:ribosomal RNA methyltransferase Nop2